jgi:hypothetical protein
MAFADLKNDFIFRRIFGTHPDILRGLLNDLLERRGEAAIVSLEYLPGEQLPLIEGAKLSILDVRCHDGAGTTFVVEMQLIHHPGFINRVVYNACKAYAGQLKAGDWYTTLTDVVAISICDFELWPDARQDQKQLPRVPMLSRWKMSEQASKNEGLLQVQYAFLELPKMPSRRPDAPGAGLWAWLFVHAPELTEVPADLAPGPYGAALELANQAKFTAAELQAYEKARDEIRQVLEIAAARWAEGLAEGEIKGFVKGETVGVVKGKVEAILAVLAARSLPAGHEIRARVEACTDVATLDRWLVRAVTAASAEEIFAEHG